MTIHLAPGKWLRSSLFLRLLVIFGITVLLLIGIASVTSQSIWKNNLNHDFGRAYFSRHIMTLIEELGTPPDLNLAAELVNNLPVTMIIQGPSLNWQSDSRTINLNRLRDFRSLANNITVVRGRGLRGIKATRDGFDYYLFWKGHLLNDKDFQTIYWAIAAALAVLFLNYWLVRRLLKPIHLLKDGAERISQGELDFRVSNNRNDELGDLTGSINHMADSLQQMLEAKHQLLLAISHELRSPITRAKVQLEFIDNDTIKNSLKDDLNELELLVTELLEAERLNSNHASLNLEPVLLGEFISNAVKQFWPNNNRLLLNISQPDKSLQIDCLRFSLLLRNLINNALHHTGNQPVSISLKHYTRHSLLSVHDSGKGIAEEHIAHLTEPFYRADSARQRKTGGFGLGLYLCKLITEAHNGKLDIQSSLGKGTNVTVNLPVRPET